jgi:galactokinase
MDDTIYKRCRYIVGENQRLLRGCDLLKDKNLDEFGKLMYESHNGLSQDYEVSCPESDFLVQTVHGLAGVRGARQMGGGFGGCIITLVDKDSVENFIGQIRNKYEEKFARIPDCYIMNIDEGARMLKQV